MIEPQNGQWGVIGQQHGLQRLTETLEALSAGQQQQQARDRAMQEHLTAITQHQGQVLSWGRRLFLGVGALAALTLVLAGVVGWQVWHPPEQGYARALGALDTTLIQQWSALPKGAQEALADTYRRMGLLPPSQRK
jgi:cytochrome c-type biogenesis protein CcmH/NrfG